MQKFSFALFALAFVLFFSSCSLLFNASSSDEATLTFRLGGELFSKMKNSRAVVDDAEDGYYLDIEIKGGFSAKKTASLSQSGATVSFEEIPEGVTIWAQAQAYEVVDGEKVIYFVGESDKVTIAEGENEISLVMKKYESADTDDEEIGAKFYVSANAEANTVGDGSKEKPFKSVEIALQSLPTTSENIILILSGAFQTPQTIYNDFALASGCTLTIRGGDSSAKLSEGFTSSSSSAVPITLKDLSISSNIEVETSTKVTLYNVKSAGQVVIYGNGQLLLKGSTVIEGELKPLDADAKIIVAGPLSASTVATITPSEYTSGLQLIEVAEGAGVSMSNVYKKFKVKANGTTEWQLNSSGQLEKKTSTEATVGSVVLSDGTYIAQEDISSMTAEQKAKAIAVIFYVGSTSDPLGEKTLGLGIEISADTMTWSTSQIGQSSNTQEVFSDILCTNTSIMPYDTHVSYDYSGTSYLFGDLDGSDNWSAVQTADPNSSISDYPAFEWANNYAATYSITGKYASGWYLPTAAEMITLYVNLYSDTKTINSIMELLNKTTLEGKDFLTSNRTYNQSDNFLYYSILAGFNTGTPIHEGVSVGTGYACAIREF